MFAQAARTSSRRLAASAQGQARLAATSRRYAHSPAAFDWKDPLGASNLWTEEELAIAETAEEYCQEKMLPRVLGERDHTHHVPV